MSICRDTSARHARFSVVHSGQCDPQHEGADADRRPGNQPLLSMASLWEMAIKLSLGKLSFTQSFETFVPQQMREDGVQVLTAPEEIEQKQELPEGIAA